MSIALLLGIALGIPNPSGAAPQGGNGKLDPQLQKAADQGGESDVIVEFYDDVTGPATLRGFGNPGRHLGILKAFTTRVPNGLLKQLEKNPNVKKISLDRPVDSLNGRTAVTVGARAVQELMQYNGAGIGVAVIDSGITPWHDDLTVANRSGQRVTVFMDFVAGRTTPYDDWGHGTHVAGTIAGNGYDSFGVRKAIAPGASIIALKALKGDGTGTISGIIAAIDFAVTNRSLYNVRVINLSVGAGVFESYKTDPLTVACKRAVDAGIVVVAAAGNMGTAKDGSPQYGAISAPGNAPWVITVGASSTEGTIDRSDDTVAPYSSRGPTMIDFLAKPDLVAPGTGTVSLSDPNSRMYIEKAANLVPSLLTSYKPYLTLSGTSMAAPVVSGTVALMLQANPKLTPNLVKAILQYTAQVYPGYNWLTQGAGFLNTRGAVILAEYFRKAQKGSPYPIYKGWSQHIFWGNYRVKGGVLTPGGTAWATNIVWGDLHTPAGQAVVWGENCDSYGTCADDNIVWGNNVVWGNSVDLDDNIVWGNTDVDNIVWGNGDDDNVVWGNGEVDNIVWGNEGQDNIVWGNDCDGANCDNVVWGNSDEDNVVWGNAEDLDNIVWANSADLNAVWGTSDDGDNVSWGNSADDSGEVYVDDNAELSGFDPTVWDILFEISITEDPLPPGEVQ